MRLLPHVMSGSRTRPRTPCGRAPLWNPLREQGKVVIVPAVGRRFDHAERTADQVQSAPQRASAGGDKFVAQPKPKLPRHQYPFPSESPPARRARSRRPGRPSAIPACAGECAPILAGRNPPTNSYRPPPAVSIRNKIRPNFAKFEFRGFIGRQAGRIWRGLKRPPGR